MDKFIQFFKNEAVLCISAAFAIVSAFFVPPSKDYFGYIDFRVLVLLFCLMAVVSGFFKTGVFDVISKRLIKYAKGTKILSLILILLCFFSSMFITNDVALITYVPFTISVLSAIDKKNLIFVIVMQTVASNIGSMLTPIGNPQNLYIYSFYNIALPDFLKITYPVCLVGLVLIIAACFFIKNQGINISYEKQARLKDTKKFIVYCFLFCICLLTVFRLVNFIICFIIVIAALFFTDKTIFRRVDYCLLLTFVCFYIFVGNIQKIDIIRNLISSAMEGKELIFSALISQVISNVPAAVMLCPFTKNSHALLIGCNVGGLGTLIASLASLISFKFYAQSDSAQTGRYVLVFTIINVIFLAALMAFSLFVLN